MYSVYIHVPFCIRRCGYCDFNTYTSPDLGGGASRGNYANLAVREMVLARQWQESQGIEEPAASTIFFGGGTPTILAAHDLIRMVDAVRAVWGIEPEAEITTEANPDTVDHAYLAELKAGGFTRVSFGMQSAVPSVLATLDRTHTPANVESGVKAAQALGLETSVDLIYGTPGESIQDWDKSLRAAIDLGTGHISAYALTVESHTRMGRQISRGIIAAPDDDDQAAKYRAADQAFTQAGLDWYEVSNWARPGHESRHNLGYWHNVDWVGIGPGAHSHYRRGKASAAAEASGLRAWDIAHPRKWAEVMAEGRLPWQGSESLGWKEKMEEAIMLGLRIRDGLDLARLDRLADAGVEGPEGPEGLAGPEGRRRAKVTDLVSSLSQEGLAVYDPQADALTATLEGRMLNDLLIERFFEAYGL